MRPVAGVGLVIAACSSSPPAKPVLDGVEYFQLDPASYVVSGSFQEVDPNGVWHEECVPCAGAACTPGFQWVQLMQQGACLSELDRATQTLCISIDPAAAFPWTASATSMWARSTDLGGTISYETVTIEGRELSYVRTDGGSDAVHYYGSCKLVFDAWM